MSERERIAELELALIDCANMVGVINAYDEVRDIVKDALKISTDELNFRVDALDAERREKFKNK